MERIEIHCIGRWVKRTDFEGLVERLGESHAADIWDVVAKHGSFTARNGIVYLRAASILNGITVAQLSETATPWRESYALGPRV